MAPIPPPLATILPSSSKGVTWSRGTGRVPPPPVDARANASAPCFDWVPEDVLSFSSSMDSIDSLGVVERNVEALV